MEKEIIWRNLEVNDEDHENNLPDLVEQLRQLIANAEDKFPSNRRIDSDFLSLFLRVKNYDVQKAFKTMQSAYRCLGRNEIIVKGIKPISLVPMIKTQFFYGLKSPDELGSHILILQPDNWDPSKFPLRDLMANVVFQAQEAITQSKAIQRHGLQLILDMNGLSLHHLKQVTPSEIKRIVQAIQDGFPVKVKGFHIINYPRIFWIVYSFAVRLLSKKLRQRIHFHKSCESLHLHFNPAILPQELDGTLTRDEAINQEFNDSMLARNDYFEKYYFNTDDQTASPCKKAEVIGK